MSLAVVTEVTDRFKTAIAKWKVGDDQILETRFLLSKGIYIGHCFRWGEFEGRWINAAKSIKIYRGGQWLMTVPVDVEIETIQSPWQRLGEAKSPPPHTTTGTKAGSKAA